jgi:hypothetical protein
MATVLLGSESPKAPQSGTQANVNGEAAKSDETVSLPERTLVLIDTPDVDAEGNKVPLDKRLQEIRNAFALHSESGAAWVEGEDENFTNSVSQVFDCPVGRPDSWKEEQTNEPKQTEEERPSDAQSSAQETANSADATTQGAQETQPSPSQTESASTVSRVDAESSTAEGDNGVVN